MAIFKRFRLISWVTKAFLSKHGKIIGAASLVGIIGFFGVFKIFPYLPQPKPSERRALIGQYSPENLPDEILNLLSIGLTIIAEDGSAVSGLAKNWEITDEGKTYTFFLNDDLFWQDETRLKASELVYQFNDVEEEFLDDKTIRFKLKEPFSPLTVVLSKPVFKENYLGVGPYRIIRIKKSGNLVESVTLANSEKEIIFKFYPTEESAILAFKLGKIDIIDNLLSNQMNEDWQKSIVTETRVAKNRFVGLFFNTQGPFLTDKSVRQSLAYAIKDKPEGETRAVSPISPLSWAYNPNIKFYEFDVVKANDLFKKEDDEEKEKIKISTTQSFLKLAEEVKKSWQETLDLEVEIEVINALSPDYQVFLGAQEIPPDPDQYMFWHSTRAENITQLKSVKIDKILEDGRKILDRQERKEKYFDFQQVLSEESPVVFITHPTIYTIKRKKLFK